MASQGDILSETRSDVVETVRTSSGPDSRWEQRILQLEGKRYSLRLEHEFWAALEEIAAASQVAPQSSRCRDRSASLE
jgi:hypothetical protein